MNDKKYYVYKHYRREGESLKPFYLGKGCGKRAYDRSGRNKYWRHIADKHGFLVEIIEDNLTEVDAYMAEKALIRAYQTNGLCEANMRDGGRDGFGLSADARKRISAAQKRRYQTTSVWNKGKKGVQKAWNKGIPHSEECRRKMRLAWESRDTTPWNKGVPPSREAIEKNVSSRGCRPFEAHCLKTKEKVWEGLLQTDFIKFAGLNDSSKGNISMCLKGVRKSHKGYTFKYCDAPQTPRD